MLDGGIHEYMHARLCMVDVLAGLFLGSMDMHLGASIQAELYTTMQAVRYLKPSRYRLIIDKAGW